MRHASPWCLLIACAALLAGPSEVRGESQPSLVVVAKLVDLGRPVSHCGRAHYVVVMRYQVDHVVSGDYAERELLVAQSCPEMGHGPSGGDVHPFRIGETYRLSLRPWDKRSPGALVDAFPDSKLPRFVASRIEVESTR